MTDFHTRALDKAFEHLRGQELADAPVWALHGVSKADAELLTRALNIRTIGDLALNHHVGVAQRLLRRAEPGVDAPSAEAGDIGTTALLETGDDVACELRVEGFSADFHHVVLEGLLRHTDSRLIHPTELEGRRIRAGESLTIGVGRGSALSLDLYHGTVLAGTLELLAPLEDAPLVAWHAGGPHHVGRLSRDPKLGALTCIVVVAPR